MGYIIFHLREGLSCLILRLEPRPCWKWGEERTPVAEGLGKAGLACAGQGSFCIQTLFSLALPPVEPNIGREWGSRPLTGGLGSMLVQVS